MDIVFYIDLVMYLISFIAVAYAIDVIVSIKGELDDLRKE